MKKKLNILIFFILEIIVSNNILSQVPFPDLVIENQTINTGTYLYTNCTGIISPSSDALPMIITGNANVEYKAGVSIDLKPGFSAHPTYGTGNFHAHIQKSPFDVVIMEPTSNPGHVGKFEKLELGMHALKLQIDYNGRTYIMSFKK